MSFEVETRGGRIGVLLMAYGSPDSLDDVLPYYTDVRGGHAPSAEQFAVIYDHYARIGGPTGLLAISEAQTAALQARLDATAPGVFRVYLGMRHWRPYIADTVRQMAADGVREAVAIALTPQDSRISVGAYIASVEKALDALPHTGATPMIRFSFVRSWHDEPLFIQLLARRVREATERLFTPDERVALHIVFTAHSLPQRILNWNDPYPAELRTTMVGVAQKLRLDDAQWTFAYQSAGRTSEPWLGPAIHEVVPWLAAGGVRAVLVCPVGFVADNLEILYDIDIELRALAAQRGIHLERITLPNTDALLIEALADVACRAARTGTMSSVARQP